MACCCLRTVFVFGALDPTPSTHPPPVGQDLLIHEIVRSHTTTQHIRWDFSGRGISSSQRPLPDNTQHTQQTNVHSSRWIRAHNLRRRTIADLLLISSGHWDRPSQTVVIVIPNMVFMIRLIHSCMLYAGRNTGIRFLPACRVS